MTPVSDDKIRAYARQMAESHYAKAIKKRTSLGSERE
jgi:hypothetical protein